MKKTRVFVALLLAASIATTMQPFAFATITPVSAAKNQQAMLSGEVAEIVTKYGNIQLSISSKDLLKAGFEIGDIVTLNIAEKALEVPICTSYSDVNNGKVILTISTEDETKPVTVAINMGDFATTYGIKKGIKFSITMKEKAGYLDEYNIRQLKRTYDRSDYASDEVYANFREVTCGKIAEGVLYRSSSPVNNEISRAVITDSLIKKANIATAINLADTKEEVDGFLKDTSFQTPYYQSLVESGKVCYLSMGLDFTTKEFEAKLKEGILFMLDNEAPYIIHCTEGKDRTGFTVALFEALMSATKEEIKVDYAESFVNFFHVEKDSVQYNKIAETNIFESLRQLAGLKAGASLDGVDLEKAAESYLTKIGLTKTQIQGLKTTLSTTPTSVNIEIDDVAEGVMEAQIAA